jgi:adenosylcobinamide amidohydrolase
VVHDTPEKGIRRRVVILSEAASADHIATSFRTWIENSSAFFITAGFQPPASPALGRHGTCRDANRVFEHRFVLVVTFFGRK